MLVSYGDFNIWISLLFFFNKKTSGFHNINITGSEINKTLGPSFIKSNQSTSTPMVIKDQNITKDQNSMVYTADHLILRNRFDALLGEDE